MYHSSCTYLLCWWHKTVSCNLRRFLDIRMSTCFPVNRLPSRKVRSPVNFCTVARPCHIYHTGRSAPSRLFCRLPTQVSSGCSSLYVLLHCLYAITFWATMFSFSIRWYPSHRSFCYRFLVQSLFGIPYLATILHSDSLWMQSNAFLKSMKFNRTGVCQVKHLSIIILKEKIWSQHNPAWLGRSVRSTAVLILFNNMLAMTFPGRPIDIAVIFPFSLYIEWDLLSLVVVELFHFSNLRDFLVSSNYIKYCAKCLFQAGVLGVVSHSH